MSAFVPTDEFTAGLQCLVDEHSASIRMAINQSPHVGNRVGWRVKFFMDGNLEVQGLTAEFCRRHPTISRLFDQFDPEEELLCVVNSDLSPTKYIVRLIKPR